MPGLTLNTVFDEVGGSTIFFTVGFMFWLLLLVGLTGVEGFIWVFFGWVGFFIGGWGGGGCLKGASSIF